MSISTRSTLAPYLHPKRRKWYPRGTFPVKDETGRISRRRDFRGSGSDTRALCQAECDRLNREIEAEVNSGPLAPRFDEAVLVYLRTGRERRFLAEKKGGPPNKILEALGHYRCTEIDDAVMTRVGAEHYPNVTKASLNRQLYTPVIAVLRLASKGKPWKPDITRPKGYGKLKPAKAPDKDWFATVLPACPPNLRALLLLGTMHRVRAGDAARLLPADFDPDAKTLTISHTKTFVPVHLKLADAVVDALRAYDWKAGPGLFGNLTHSNKRRIWKELARVCKRVGVPYFTPHKAGSHAFAKRLLDAGYSLAHVKSAGRWESITIVAELYGHLEHSEVADETTKFGNEWARKLPKSDDSQPGKG